MTYDNKLLLRALKLNAIFSGFSALCMFITGTWLAAQFSLRSNIPIYLIASVLAVFAFLLTNIARTGIIRTWEVTMIIVGDIAWVVASVVLLVLFYRTITPTAVVLVDLVAIIVLIFAVMQIRGLTQYQKQEAQT
ncbi:MAG: hypothetical protein AB8B64_23460 [Granulosicoccus sp.]